MRLNKRYVFNLFSANAETVTQCYASFFALLIGIIRVFISASNEMMFEHYYTRVTNVGETI